LKTPVDRSYGKNGKRIRAVKVSGRAASAPLRWLLSLLLLMIAIQAFRLASSDYSRQSLLAEIQLIVTGEQQNAFNLPAATRALVDSPFPGAMADVRADALSLLHFYVPGAPRSTPGSADDNAVISEFQSALRVRPDDGYLWAKYGNYLSSLQTPVHQAEVLAALDRALELSPRDYNTIRLAADLGVRRWPDLKCDTRRALVAVLDYAKAMDDGILARWNTRHRLKPMARYLEELYALYDFSPAWARINALNCSQGA
jgi:hypothetical protein